MLDIEVTLALRLHWTLADLDRTDIESLIPFFFRLIDSAEEEENGSIIRNQNTYCDQAEWL